MTQPVIQAALDEALADTPALHAVHVFEKLESTNSWLSERPALAAGQAEAVLALHQTAGRGRRGKTWQAPRKSGLALSVSYQFPAMPSDPGAISLALGVATARVLESLGTGEIMLKWPNDIVWQDQKLGGILVESVSNAAGFKVVAGIGINLALPEGFSLGDAASWSKGAADLAHTDADTTLPALATVMIPAIIETLAAYSPETLVETIEGFNRRHWLNERAAELDGKMLRCESVDEAGRLRVIDMQDGKMRTIDSGDVTPIAWSASS